MNSIIRLTVKAIKYAFRKIYSSYQRQYFSSCDVKFQTHFPIEIVGGENIKIGSNFFSMGNSSLYGNNGSLCIGNNLNLNRNVMLNAAEGKIIIGDNVLIGPNTVLRAANHGILKDELICLQPHEYGKIVIADDVWIGANVVVLPNVTIACGTVVAAGAVVNKDTLPYSIMAGVPAKQIGTRTG